LRQLQQELRDTKYNGDAKVSRLRDLGLESEREARETLQACKEDAAREIQSLRGDMIDSRSVISKLHSQLEANGLVVEGLRESVIKVDNRVREEHRRVEELENEKEATARAIWVRKYDPASPRRFHTGDDAFARESESDPIADTSGVWAGQVGFAQM